MIVQEVDSNWLTANKHNDVRQDDVFTNRIIQEGLEFFLQELEKPPSQFICCWVILWLERRGIRTL
jgi:hypothetical protein